MGIDISFDFKNIEDELKLMVKGIKEAEDEIILKSAELVAEKMKQRVKKSAINYPGYKHIKDSIKISSPKLDDDGEKIREIYGANKTGYKWKFLEYGTVNMNAMPFMQNSVDETAAERKNISERILKGVVEK